MDPLKRSPAKNTKSTETADTTTYQVVGELTNEKSVVITGAGAYDLWRKFLLVESFGILIHASKQNVQGDANSCPFTANTFRPESE